MTGERSRRVLLGLRDFYAAPPLPAGDEDGSASAARLFRDVAGTVPAYREFLAEHGVDPESTDWSAVPLLTKENYLRRHPLPRLCRNGRLDASDMVAVSSGSSGQPRSGRARCSTNSWSLAASSTPCTRASGPTSAARSSWCASRSATGSAGCTRRRHAGTSPRRATRHRGDAR
jgi:hypothetical protein